MKKTFTLLATVVLMVSAAFAQRNNNNNNYGGNNHDAVSSNRGYDKHDKGGYSFSQREKDMQIAQINFDYDRKIRSVQNKFFMSKRQKDRKIYFLQAQRDNEISAVVFKFNDKKNWYGANDNWKGDRNRRN